MVSTSEFENGLVILIENELYTIIDFQHFKMGRGGAFIRTKLKNIKSGRVIEKTFRSGDKVEQADIERRHMQYLYGEGTQLVFMDNETYEQLNVESNLLKSGVDFLKENEKADIFVFKDEVVGVEIPNFVQLLVVNTEPGKKGDTVSGATKRAELESGGVVQVPLFVLEGDIVKVDTRTGTYVERVKQ
jgi:elongation factor P